MDISKAFSTGKFDRFKMKNYIDSHSFLLEEIFEIALMVNESAAWRATWFLFHLMEPNDRRMKRYVGRFINILPEVKDSHQREILKLLQLMDIPVDFHGKLLNICVQIWSDVSKISSVRISAFRFMYVFVKFYPELKYELHFYAQNHYTDPLSPGIRRSVEKLLKHTSE